MSNQTKKTHGALPGYPSMSSCASATGIPMPILRAAKRAGCPAFDQGNRVHLGPLLRWLFRPDAAENAEHTDWHQRFKRAQALAAELELDQAKGHTIERAWVAARIQEAAATLKAQYHRAVAEHPVRLAACSGDIAETRECYQAVWSDIFVTIQSLGDHFAESEKTTPKNETNNQ